MNSTVFRHALRQARRTVAILAVAAGAFFYLVLLSSSSFIADRQALPFFRKPPRAVEAFMGGSADLLSPGGWLATSMSHPITLALFTAAALIVAAGAVATELERGTVDLVLSRPVGRRAFLTGKMAASIVCVTIVEAGAVTGALVARLTVKRVDEIGLAALGRTFLGSWILFVTLGMVGALVSTRSSLRARANGTATGLIVGWFFANFIALLFDEVSWMRYASPFHYFRAADALAGRPVALDFSVLAALAVGCAALAVWWFGRRDLTS